SSRSDTPTAAAHFPPRPPVARGAPPNTPPRTVTTAMRSHSRNRCRFRERDLSIEARGARASRPRCKAARWFALRRWAAGDLRRRPAENSPGQTRAAARGAWRRAREGRECRARRVAYGPLLRAVADANRVEKERSRFLGCGQQARYPLYRDRKSI